MQQTPSNATALHDFKNQQDNTNPLHYDTGLIQDPTSGYVNYDDIKGNTYTSSETANTTQNNNEHEPRMSINPKQHAPVMVGRNNEQDSVEQVDNNSLETKEPNTSNEQRKNNNNKKPLNTRGDAHHIAEQPSKGLGGLTGKQPVGEVNFKKM
ncbi:uncharacterized protein B0P05DRAFT_534076 [Gilbertella persicaria]|uniref:uncharacterized protein n=1 Tax=Gilbertella persicaria TaxID=101096 RepID=UPI00221F429D|nr:uncharacterized protein B0P05DRAFT_534076 [Gilbertella persicaria]KAI8085880.1 hypothetical protein B0P05DRAFT_534076 [Gilbertella persicaria]